MIDYTKRPTSRPDADGRTGQWELHVSWPEVRQASLFRELRHQFFSPHGGAGEAQLQIFSVVLGPDGAEPMTASRRDTPSSDGSVQHRVTSPPTPDTFANAVRTGMPSGSEAVSVDTTSWAPGTSAVFIAAAFRSFELAQLGPVDCRLVDPASGRDLRTFSSPRTDRPHNCRILARLTESATGRWELTPIGDVSVGRTLAEFVSATRRHV